MKICESISTTIRINGPDQLKPELNIRFKGPKCILTFTFVLTFHPFPGADTPEIPSSSIELTSTWLAAAGVRLLGGAAPAVKRCTPRPPALLIADEATVPRSDFSEVRIFFCHL